MKVAHLGLGNFFRAHQAAYTARAGGWSYVAFSGRRHELVDALRAQDGHYTLVIRGPERDEFEDIDVLHELHAGDDEQAWLRTLTDPDVQALTLTVTEAGYQPGGVAVSRIAAALTARHRKSQAPITIVPCDNIADNAEVLRTQVLRSVDDTVAAWAEQSVGFVTTMVDRITPRPTAELVAAVRAATGRDDACAVVTEPFSEWVLQRAATASLPDWQAAGARYVDDVAPYERRKLWLLNGAHSLLAYSGLIRGHRTVAEAIDDPVCAGWVEEWWDDAVPHVRLPAGELADYRAALRVRFANPRMAHLLAQIAEDAEHKLRMRVLPVVSVERAAGRLPPGAVRLLSCWVRFRGGTARDALAALDPALADDADLVRAAG